MTPKIAIAAAVLGVAISASGWAQTRMPELVARTELRVCADPNNLPFSNRDGQGFENRVASTVAKNLGLPLATTWFPQVGGFVRNTLLARQCDLVMGTVSGDPAMEATNPYYHSGYMIVTRTADRITTRTLGDVALAGKKIGVVAATPPTDLLLRHGLMRNVRSYSLAVDTRYESPGRAMLQDLVDGSIDVGLLWGPIAGYWIAHEHLPLTAAFVEPEEGAPRLDYYIAMGVRPGEADWRRRINAALEREKPDIAAILAEYAVPQLDTQGRPLVPTEH